jgi:hypothetical protein
MQMFFKYLGQEQKIDGVRLRDFLHETSLLRKATITSQNGDQSNTKKTAMACGPS